MTTVRQLLSANVLRPRKKLGQSFLEDGDVLKRIVALVSPSEDETVVEIGAGLGLMTEEMAKKSRRVVALEIDPRLLDILHERLDGVANVDIVGMDVLKYDFSRDDEGKKIKVVGNIPYYISTPILFRLLSYRKNISSFTLMFQKELTDRITAGPGSKKYGIPSVMVAKYTRATYEMTVPRGCFYPVPDVDSAVARMVVNEGDDDPGDPFFDRLVHAAFAHRRKNIFNNLLSMGFSKETLHAVFSAGGIDPGRRAETLTVEEFTALAALLSEKSDR